MAFASLLAEELCIENVEIAAPKSEAIFVERAIFEI
ncbi:MAG: hypothetical protein QOD67_139 [Caballeronia sp.]|jgi:hypothetical protein|nr:hypothetical protein [Caballeronia sp.]